LSLSLCFPDTATPAIYTLSLHDALPICRAAATPASARRRSRRRRPPRREGRGFLCLSRRFAAPRPVRKILLEPGLRRHTPRAPPRRARSPASRGGHRRSRAHTRSQAAPRSIRLARRGSPPPDRKSVVYGESGELWGRLLTRT